MRQEVLQCDVVAANIDYPETSHALPEKVSHPGFQKAHQQVCTGIPIHQQNVVSYTS